MPQNLKNSGAALSAKFDDSIDWLRNAQKLKSSEKQRLDLTHRDVRKVLKALDKKPVFALFGASQVGKSYLANIILSGEQPELMVDLGETHVDFLTHINPVGKGAEATGVVTRFTINPVQHESHPVLVRMLSFEDVCLVLCNAYYNNFQPQSFTKEALNEHLDETLHELKALNELTTLPEDAEYWVTDLQSSLLAQFKQFESYWRDIDQLGLWDLLAGNLRKLLANPTILAEAMSPLWKRHPGLTEIAAQLFAALHDLGWKETCHLKGEAVLRSQHQGHAIVDVETLKPKPDDKSRVLGKDDVTLSAFTSHEVAVRRDIMSAITKEIVLTVVKEDLPADHYLRRADIMDFPGARSPIHAQDLDKAALPYIRGKVSHLFDQYSRDYEINNLLFCMNDVQNNVKELPTILASWIDKNVGETPEKRAALIERRDSNPLLVVFTWFNRQLNYDETADFRDNLGDKWSRRFYRFFESEMVGDATWAGEWTPNQRFKGIFPLRDYGFESIFDGYEPNEESGLSGGKETGLKAIASNQHFENAEDFMKVMKSSFLEHEACQKYLEDPTSTWESCATLNQDGSGPIVAAMEHASHSSGLEQNARRVLTDAVTMLIELLAQHHYSGDAAEREKAASELKAELQLFMLPGYTRSRGTLLHLQRTLCLKPKEVFEWLDAQRFGVPTTDGQAIQNFLDIHPDVHSEMTPSEVVQWFMNQYQCESEADAEQTAWSNYEVDLRNLFSADSSNAIHPVIEKAIQHFGQTRLVYSSERHAQLIEAGMSEDLLLKLLIEFKLGIKSIKLAERVSKHLAGRPEILAQGDVNTRELSELIAHQWNEYLFFANAGFYDEEDLHHIHFQAPDKPGFKEAAYEKVTSMFKAEKQNTLRDVHFTPGLETTKGWMERIHNLITINCGIPNYDVEANNILGRYIQELKQIQKAVST
jgi:hypothetical protein